MSLALTFNIPMTLLTLRWIFRFILILWPLISMNVFFLFLILDCFFMHQRSIIYVLIWRTLIRLEYQFKQYINKKSHKHFFLNLNSKWQRKADLLVYCTDACYFFKIFFNWEYIKMMFFFRIFSFRAYINHPKVYKKINLIFFKMKNNLKNKNYYNTKMSTQIWNNM